MNYPTPQAYNEALQMAQLSILDPTLRSGRVETDALGLPFGRTGSFAITFKIAAGGGNYAFRCFLQNRATIHERYDAISSHLKSVQLPYFVDFSYLDAGIRVDGTTYPTVRMSWAGGIPLGLYIQDHHTDTGRMTALHQQIQGLALALGAAGLAHGDIQGGNLLIADGGAIKLVDYDGMYVPAIAALGAIETGHPNFQHPERAANRPFDARVDQFSFALLHTVIAALIENPGLWTQLNSDPDKILLGERDLVDPFSSPAFAALTQLPSSGKFAQSLQAISAAPYGQVPDFTDFLNHRNIPTDRSTTRTQARPSAKDTGSSAPWYADYVPGLAQPAATAGGALGSYIATVPVVDAAEPTTWVGSRTWEVEVIGQIADVETGESGKEIPYARLTVRSGDPALSVDLWAEGIRRFAEQGTTVDAAWTGQWMSARGILQGPIGSPTGTRYSMTITQPERLERITAQQARWRLATATTKATPPSSEQTMPSNAGALSTLTGKTNKSPTIPRSMAPPPFPAAKVTAAKRAPNAVWTSAVFWISAGVIAAFLILAITILILDSTNSALDQPPMQEPQRPTSTLAIGACVTRTQDAGFFEVSCNSRMALYTVASTTTTTQPCPAGLQTWATDGSNICLEPSAPDLLDVQAQDCLGADGYPAGCASPTAVSTVSAVAQTPTLCETGRSRAVVNAPDRYLCLQPIVDYKTCVEGPNYQPTCFNKLEWEYALCWDHDGVAGIRLEQFKKSTGQWETVKRDIASLPPSSVCDPDYPTLVEFTRKASTAGVKRYRLVFPETAARFGFTDELTITVTEEPRS